MAISERNRQIFEGAGFDAIKLEIAYGGIRFNLGRQDIAAEAREWLVETEAKMRADREALRGLALLWQIYSCCFFTPIHIRQFGHCSGFFRMMRLTMAWRTAGNVG